MNIENHLDRVNGKAGGADQARAKSFVVHQCCETCCISHHHEGVGLCCWALTNLVVGFYCYEKI